MHQMGEQNRKNFKMIETALTVYALEQQDPEDFTEVSIFWNPWKIDLSIVFSLLVLVCWKILNLVGTIDRMFSSWLEMVLLLLIVM